VGQAEEVAHLVLDGGEQVEVPGRRLLGRGVEPRRGVGNREFAVVVGGRIDEPAVAAAVVADVHVPGHLCAQVTRREGRRYVIGGALESGNLDRCQSGGLPALKGGGNRSVEFILSKRRSNAVRGRDG